VKVGTQSFVLADIPGLIEGAHEGQGLGTRFLGHVERCAVLLHLIDVTADDPVQAYRAVRQELKEYGAGLDKKAEIVAFNKIDAVAVDELSAKLAAFKRRVRRTPLAIFAATRQGVDEAMKALLERIERDRRERSGGESAEAAWRP